MPKDPSDKTTTGAAPVPPVPPSADAALLAEIRAILLEGHDPGNAVQKIAAVVA